MDSLEGLACRLDTAKHPDRQLDAEVVAKACGPDGATLNAIEDIDGWGIDYPPDKTSRIRAWMPAFDVPYCSRYLDAASEVVSSALPDGGASVVFGAFNKAPKPYEGESTADYCSRLARLLCAELMRALSQSRKPAGRRAAA